MFNLQKFFLILFFFVAPIIAMENDKAIMQNKKSIFVPTTNTSQANADLLKIIASKRGMEQLQEEDWENISECLKNGADPNLKSGHLKRSLIDFAIRHDKKDIFDYLLQLGADINAAVNGVYNGLTPLHSFIYLGNSINFSTEYLLQNNANPNAIDSSKRTALLMAVECRHLDAVCSLIRYNANVQKSYGIAPLKFAVISKHIEIIKQLCKAGACVINLDAYNHTAFHIAANLSYNPYKEVIKTLITHIKFNNDEDITNTIKTFLLVFNRFNNDSKSNIYKIPHIPHELQILILSKLLSVHTFHKGLYKQCKGENYQQLPLKLVNEHIQHLKHILQIKNNNHFAAIELLPKYGDRADVKLLLDGSKLQNDLDILNETYPDITSISQDNLARQIFENHYKFQHITKEQINV